ncbi:MAG: DinB family protein [Acidobacteriota bacterium]|nr:DinB family protein [Acidobacteriota bacterium]
MPSRYAAALGDDDPVVVMAETPDLIRKLLRGLSEKQLRARPAPGKWCIQEIVAHLADGEVILGSRYRFIAAHDRPVLMGYDQDAFVERLGSLSAKAVDLLDDFAMARAVNLGLLDRLPAEAWDRVGLHAERGEESIRYTVATYAGHDRIHLSQIETIRTGLFPKAGKKRPARRTARRR